MNKKFSTLMALALLAGSLPVAAQYCPQNGEVPYRTREVKAATLDRVFRDVYKINPNYYYQLQVNPSSLGIKSEDDKTGSFIEKSQFQYVLTVERDYSTGKLYLTAQKVTDATLIHSLWKIETTGREANSRVFKFVNKETGFELSFDHFNALQRVNNKYYIPSLAEKTAEASQYTDNKANFGWTYEKDGLLDGCNFNWAWYTTDDNGSTPFPYKALFSYYHANQDSVMYLKAVKNADLTANNNIAQETYAATDVNGASRRELELGLSENGLTGTATSKEGFAIVAAKDSKSNAQNYLAKAGDALQIRPVVAGAKVLDADEINRMVDADASLLKFNPNVANYDAWANASNATDSKDDEKLYTKFTLLEPGGKEALTVAGVNPLGYDFKAIQNPLNALDRKSYSSTKNITAGATDKSIYAGYNILFQTTEPIDQAGNQKKYGYLAVHEHNYENTESGVYNGLQVVVQEYATLGKAAGTANATRNNYLNVNDAWAADPAASKYVPDALEARYHWKVTYYATNDSLVLEPLNASRMKQSDMDNKVAFEKTHLATAQPGTYLNTINRGVAYPTSGTIGTENGMYSKADGVPVALYAMNNSSVGDDARLITVGPAANKAMQVNANDPKWAARSKFADATASQDNPAYVTNALNSGTVTNLAQAKAISYQSEMKMLLRFDHKYTWLKRATVPTGLYYINLQSKKVGNNPQHPENREFGAYIVEDFKGHVVYDASQKEQDFSHMPATQWVVEQQPCTVDEASGMLNYNKYPTVSIHNREFANEVFNGQLYQDREDPNKLFTINHRDYNWYPVASTVDKHVYTDDNAHNGIKLNCADTIVFQKVANPTTLGYFNANEDILRENVYRFQQMYNMNLDQFLGIQNLSAQMDTLKLLPETADGLSCEFELFRAEGWYPEAETYEYFENGVKKTGYTGTYKFHYSDSLKYGYPSEDAPQLYKTYYKVKLKDANLIDNDHRFLAIKNQHKYVIAREADIQNPANNLQFAIVSLKENNCLNGEHGYAIVNAERYTMINNASSEKLEGLYRTYVVDEYSNKYEVYFFKGAVSADKFKEFEANMSKEDVWTYAEAKTFGKVIRPVGPANNPNGNWDVTGRDNTYNYYNAEGKLLVEPITLEAKVSTSCETVSDVFALVKSNRPLYRTLDNELVLNDKKAIDIKTVDASGTAGDESLIEDSHSSQSKLYNMNYLGVENYGNPSKNEGFYVDFVQASKNSRMPQYMFVVAADSVPAYTYCDCDIHDVKHGINSDCGHSEDYAGYVAGRFLVNFNDSVKASIDKLIPGIDKFSFNNYTRLGFVEAVHRGDSLYVLKAPYTLDMINMVAADGSGKKYIKPTYLSKDSAGVVYDLITLTGKHNNVAFALRNTGDAEGENGESSFLIESNDCYNNPETGEPMSIYSKVGSFAGAWIKIHNNVPVLSKVSDKNGNHNTGDTTDSWLNMGDWVTGGTYGELINQAARFTFKTIDKDSQATANEEITAEGNVIVAGANGAVVVKGAEGKNVIVSTILGKVVANEVVSSDNATIAAPAGIVVVSVDGESFKVVVK